MIAQPENEIEMAKIVNSDVYGYFTFKTLIFYIACCLESHLEYELYAKKGRLGILLLVCNCIKTEK
ncbi:hypothetical protein AS4_42610 [Acinetobacter guillouiae]|nr:hypothetical protein AS4_42610 [Acinetobacter guillouiae]